jgi:predicted enzyme related to lactoylglutathione lyase
MPLLKRETSRKGRAIIWLAAGEGRVELYGGKPGQALRPAWEPDGVGPISIGLLVKELDRTVERLRSAGVTILKPPYEPVPGERAAMVAGPDAEEIVLLEKPVS